MKSEEFSLSMTENGEFYDVVDNHFQKEEATQPEYQSKNSNLNGDNVKLCSVYFFVVVKINFFYGFILNRSCVESA